MSLLRTGHCFFCYFKGGGRERDRQSALAFSISFRKRGREEGKGEGKDPRGLLPLKRGRRGGVASRFSSRKRGERMLQSLQRREGKKEERKTEKEMPRQSPGFQRQRDRRVSARIRKEKEEKEGMPALRICSDRRHSDAEYCPSPKKNKKKKEGGGKRGESQDLRGPRLSLPPLFTTLAFSGKPSRTGKKKKGREKRGAQASTLSEKKGKRWRTPMFLGESSTASPNFSPSFHLWA